MTQPRKVYWIEVCNECGSTEVARCQWVNVNFNTVYGDKYAGVDTEWCWGECQEETRIRSVQADPNDDTKPDPAITFPLGE